MKRGQLFIKSLLLLGLLIGMPVEGLAKKQKKSSQILQRIYDYQKANNSDIDSLEDRVYAKFRFNVEKRNIFLQFIPSMYPIAKDPREYIRESYTKVLFQDSHNYDIENQVVSSTIRRNRRAMSPLLDYMTPNIYDIDLYNGHMLSPFNKCNRRYYRFTQKLQHDGTTRLEFRPKIYNTQLLNGYAIVDYCEKYGLDIKFVLAQAQTESKFGTTGLAKKTNNIFNVGAFDKYTVEEINGRYKYKHPDYSIEPYMRLLYKDYIVNNKTELDLMAKYVNKDGKRYASNTNYERDILNLYKTINKRTDITRLQAEMARYKTICGK